MYHYMGMSPHHALRTALACLLVSATGVMSTQFRPFLLQCPSFSYDAVYDFRNGHTISHPSVRPVGSFAGTGCATNGVLRLALAAAHVDPNRRRVMVDLFMDGFPTGWVFNLGDSISNNGFAGDSGNQWWDAEVQGYGTTFSGWYSDDGGSGQAFNATNLYSTRLTLLVGDGHILWLPDNNNLWNYFYSQHLFALNGQPDPDAHGNSNYDLYLGFNRVIGGNFRTGSGVCKVGIKFLREF